MTSVEGLTLTALNHAVEEALTPERCECTCGTSGCTTPTWMAISPCGHETAAVCTRCRSLMIEGFKRYPRNTGTCRSCHEVAPLRDTRWEPLA